MQIIEAYSSDLLVLATRMNAARGTILNGIRDTNLSAGLTRGETEQSQAFPLFRGTWLDGIGIYDILRAPFGRDRDVTI